MSKSKETTKSKPAKAKNKGGRPTIYTKELAVEICGRIALGETLLAICEEKKMPDRSTVMDWVFNENSKAYQDGFSLMYEKARISQAHNLFEQTLQIADDASNDTLEREDGSKIVDKECVARSRLRVDTRKWFLSKVVPKVYGDRAMVDITNNRDMRTLDEIRAERDKVQAEIKRLSSGPAEEAESIH